MDGSQNILEVFYGGDSTVMDVSPGEYKAHNFSESVAADHWLYAFAAHAGLSVRGLFSSGELDARARLHVANHRQQLSTAIEKIIRSKHRADFFVWDRSEYIDPENNFLLELTKNQTFSLYASGDPNWPKGFSPFLLVGDPNIGSFACRIDIDLACNYRSLRSDQLLRSNTAIAINHEPARLAAKRLFMVHKRLCAAVELGDTARMAG